MKATQQKRNQAIVCPVELQYATYSFETSKCLEDFKPHESIRQPSNIEDVVRMMNVEP
jgi:hypothetical protein